MAPISLHHKYTKIPYLFYYFKCHHVTDPIQLLPQLWLIHWMHFPCLEILVGSVIRNRTYNDKKKKKKRKRKILTTNVVSVDGWMIFFSLFCRKTQHIPFFRKLHIIWNANRFFSIRLWASHTQHTLHEHVRCTLYAYIDYICERNKSNEWVGRHFTIHRRCFYVKTKKYCLITYRIMFR